MTRALGDARLTLVNGGDFRLDGGAMHGVVPKVVWNRLVSCDEKNRCTYATHCLPSRSRQAGLSRPQRRNFPDRRRALRDRSDRSGRPRSELASSRVDDAVSDPPPFR